MMKIAFRNLRTAGLQLMRAAAIIITLAMASSAFAQKTDRVTFKNGDTLTVDIKEFDRGLLRASTNGIGTVYIEWDVIDSLTTDKTYRVELSSGVNFLGTIRRAEEGSNIIIQTDDGIRSIDFSDVVSMVRVKREQPFFDRIDGSVQLGMNYASGSEIGQANAGFNASLNEEKYFMSTNFSSTITTGSSTTDTRRYDWTLNYARVLPKRWFWLLNSGLSSNDELGIDLRVLGGGGFGRFLMKSNSTRLMTAAGLAVSRESRTGEEGLSQIEGQLLANYSLFFFTPKETDLSLGLALFPGITEPGRLRGNFDTKLSWEIFKDFTWNLTYYFTWDNQPAEGAASEDMGITTSLGFKF